MYPTFSEYIFKINIPYLAGHSRWLAYLSIKPTRPSGLCGRQLLALLHAASRKKSTYTHAHTVFVIINE